MLSRHFIKYKIWTSTRSLPFHPSSSHQLQQQQQHLNDVSVLTVLSCRRAHNYNNANTHTRIAIVGGGTGGMTVAAQILRQKLVSKASDITVFDKSSIHYYQPGFTMLSTGLLGVPSTNKKEEEEEEEKEKEKIGSKKLFRPMSNVFNPNINLIIDEIQEFDPDQNKIITNYGKSYTYDYLIMACGHQLRFDLIPGAEDVLQDPDSGVGSMYDFHYAHKINRHLHNFRGGKIIATQPPMPIKCAGAPQKWLYLCEEVLRRTSSSSSSTTTTTTTSIANKKDNIRDKCDIHFYTALPGMFGIKKYADELHKIVLQKNITPHFEYEVIKIDGSKKKVYLKQLGNSSSSSSSSSSSTNKLILNNKDKDKDKDKDKENIIVESYDMLHLVPPQRPYGNVAKAAFSNDSGYVEVDKHTLQSVHFDNVFALGDCSSLPTSRTAAAIFAQSPVLIYNLEKVMNGKKQEIEKLYDGYTSCPIFVGDHKLMLAEFLYDGQVSETFSSFVDQSKPTTYFYYMKKYFFPFAYWEMVPKALWYGRTGWNPPSFLHNRSPPEKTTNQTKEKSYP